MSKEDKQADKAFARYKVEFWELAGMPDTVRERRQEEFILKLAWDAGRRYERSQGDD